MNLQGRDLTNGITGTDVGELHHELMQLGFTIPPTEAQAQQFGAGTLAAVKALQAAQGLTTTGTVDLGTANALTKLLASSTFQVSGTVRSTVAAGLAGLRVQIVDKNVGGDVVLAATTTDAYGAYSTSVVLNAQRIRAQLKTSPDLQAQVTQTNTSGAVTVVARSVVIVNATSPVTLDIALPATFGGLPSEHETLTATLSQLYSGRLKDLQENDAVQDVSYLGAKSGWDARTVAMGSLADQFSTLTVPVTTRPITSPGTPTTPPVHTAPGIAPAPVAVRTATGATAAPPAASTPAAPRATTAAAATGASASTTDAALHAPSTISLQPPFYYALLRAGVPADPAGLFKIGANAAQAIWTDAIAKGIIPGALSASIPDAVTAFQALGAVQSLTAPPTFGISTLNDVITPILGGSGQASQFANLIAQHSGNWETFWPAVDTAFGTPVKQQLQLLGQLSYLTLDNAPLVTALNQAESHAPLKLPIDLATRGYFVPAKWIPLIGQSIPAGIQGSTPGERATNYAEWMAAHVKLTFPTAVLAQQIATGTVKLTDHPDVVGEATAFLTTHQADFSFGVEPVEAYIARNKLTPSAGAVTQLKRLQRTYQMTTTDTGMTALLANGLDSAYAVMRYNQSGFVRAFAGQLGGEDAALSVYRRAQQIHGVTLNVALSYAHARISPVLGGVSPIINLFGGPDAGGNTIAAATLDTLFGSLDSCGCSDCESILSPAAYLVDLLHYLDQPAAPTGSNPQAILFGRRPDLQYLPLTCENTDVALPYIDVVNETLEYFVANGLDISNFQGFDTGDTATSAELLAAPQNVNDAAYTALQGAFFPAPLPFNRSLELLRQHLQALGVSAPDTMEALRKDDRLTAANPGGIDYGWTDILIERLQISRDEMRVFDDSTLTLGDLFGLPAATALATLQGMSLHDLVRRVQIDYDDLVAILQTQFVNPFANLIPRLQRLGAPFSTIQALHDRLNTPQSIAPQFIAALPANLDYSQYGGPTASSGQDVVNWLCDPTRYAAIMSLITIVNPNNGAIDCSGDQLQLRYSNPDPSKSPLTATDWLKLIRFVRLWRKLQPLLGGDNPTTIQQTDAILSALYPTSDLPVGTGDPGNDAANRPKLDAGFAATIARAGFAFQAMQLLSLSPSSDLPSLLTCAGPIGVVGQPSFYQSLFLTPTLTQLDLGAQTATLSGPLFAGDTLHTALNGVAIDHVVAVGDTAGSVATAIAAAINASAAIDPVSSVAIGKRFLATANGQSVQIKAGFVVTLPPAGGITETLALQATSPISQTVTIAGSPTADDTVQFAINGSTIAYSVADGDTLADIAAAIRDAINGTTAGDAFSGQALNTIVAATSVGAAITLLAAGPGAPFTLGCSLQSTNDATYTVWTDSGSGTEGVTVGGTTMPVGATLTTTINGLSLYYVIAANDTSLTVASAIATLINTTTAIDPLTGLAINSLVAVSIDGTNKSMLHVAAVSPNVGFTLAASMSTTSYVAGRAASPFADNGYGAYLSDGSQRLLMHEPILCAACNLTGAEFAEITEALGYDLSTPLTLATVSALYQHGWLAHALDISVLEFLRLKAASGLNPFAALDPGAAPAVEPPLIGFIKLVQAMSVAGLAPAQALYLIWNEDISGALAPKPADIGTLALTLRGDFAGIDSTFARKDDPDGSIAQGLMALVYGASDTAFFFSLVDGTYQTSVPLAYATSSLPQPAVDAAHGQLVYDDLNKQITFKGYLDPSVQAAIKATLSVTTADKTDKLAAGAGVVLTPEDMTNIAINSALVLDTGLAAETVVVTATDPKTFTADLTLPHDGTGTPFAIAADPALPAAIDALALANSQAVAPFFAQYQELQAIYDGFATSAASLPDRHTALLNAFLPLLIEERKRQQALTDVSAAIGQDTSFANALLQDPHVIATSVDAAVAAVADLTAIETGGLTATFFLDGNPAGTKTAAVSVLGPVQFAEVAVLTGTFATGSSVTTTINGIAVPYAALATDTDLPTLAGSIAKAINTSALLDPTTKQPIGSLVNATSAQSADGKTAAVCLLSRSPADQTKVFSLAVASQDPNLVYETGLGLPKALAGQLAAGVPGPLPAPSGAATIAASLSGFIVAPQDGAYTFSLVIDAGAKATVTFGDSSAPLAFGAGTTPPAPVQLSAGVLTPITIQATGLTSTLTLCWQDGTGLGWQPVPAQYLYAEASIDDLRDSYVRFLKAASLASALSLTANEIAYLAFTPIATTAKSKVAPGPAVIQPQSMTAITIGIQLLIDSGGAQETVVVTAVTAQSFSATVTKAHDGSVTPFAIVSASVAAPDIGKGWLNLLPGTPYSDALGAAYPAPAIGVRLRATLAAVLDFARLKAALSPGDERLLQAIQGPGAILANGQSALLNLTGWQPASLNALLLRFYGSMSLASLSDIRRFARVFDALAIVQTCRVAAGVLLSAVTNAPSAAGVAALQSALRAQYAEADWLTVVKPIYDALRVAQRDALVAYILQGFKSHPPAPPYDGVDTADKLFEFFLIDVENQPAVETSRIRLALSSVQLFIERILRGLETQVSPDDIDAQQWLWMKRYRVWQANREVFLWPENWLYPELRDDQSPIFQQVMGTLLQGDITDDAAASAYLDYLRDLEEVAKLEPCGIHYVPSSDGTAGGGASDEIAYVIARTAGAHRKHYFRQLLSGSWTPWEEVKVDCEDMPLTPIVWNGRLFLFWLKIMKQQPATPAVGSNSNQGSVSSWSSGDVGNYVNSAAQQAGQMIIHAVLNWSEYYNGKWQPAKTSDINRPATIKMPGSALDRAFEQDRNRIRLLVSPYMENVPEDCLILIIHPPGDGSRPDVPYGDGFVLHNTHSLPTMTDDIPRDLGELFGNIANLPLPLRELLPQQTTFGGQQTGTFSIAQYADLTSIFNNTASTQSALLGFSWQPRFIQPQIGPGDSTHWPFFYEDRRNQFYVTVTKAWVPYSFWNGFTVDVSTAPGTVYTIPPLLVGESIPPDVGQLPPSAFNPSVGTDNGWTYSTAARGTVAALASNATFTFQGRDIGTLGGSAAPAYAKVTQLLGD